MKYYRKSLYCLVFGGIIKESVLCEENVRGKEVISRGVCLTNTN